VSICSLAFLFLGNVLVEDCSKKLQSPFFFGVIMVQLLCEISFKIPSDFSA
jgi:hypothetical protein